jgi:hypothetical protein
MAMTSADQIAFNNLGTAAGALDDKKAAYVAAAAAAATANANLASAAAALDTAWTAYKAADTTLDGLMLTPPAGYTPPV